MNTILIVEDMELNRELLAQLLEDEHKLIFAEDGLTALEVVAETGPDLILMDLSLPRMDGWEVTRRLKADPALRHIPVIVLTAHAMRGDEERCLDAGMDGYVSKPIDPRRLADALASVAGA